MYIIFNLLELIIQNIELHIFPEGVDGPKVELFLNQVQKLWKQSIYKH